MFAQSKPNSRIHAMMGDIVEGLAPTKRWELLIALGQDFLHQRLTRTEVELSRWQDYRESQYPPGATLPPGEASQLYTHEIEHALLLQVIAESEARPFVTVHYQYLNRARQRVQQILEKGSLKHANAARQAERFQAWVEQELLIELWTNWQDWLQTYKARNASRRHS